MPVFAEVAPRSAVHHAPHGLLTLRQEVRLIEVNLKFNIESFAVLQMMRVRVLTEVVIRFLM
jgi:hypothetical protein